MVYSWLISRNHPPSTNSSYWSHTKSFKNPNRSIQNDKIWKNSCSKSSRNKKQLITKAKGIPLLTALSEIELTDSNPKHFSRYIYTIRAKDGFAITFSWNELHNTPVGKRVFLLTETKSHPNNGIILISKSDRYTGRRFVKDVSEIQIERT